MKAMKGVGRFHEVLVSRLNTTVMELTRASQLKTIRLNRFGEAPHVFDAMETSHPKVYFDHTVQSWSPHSRFQPSPAGCQ